MAKNKKTEADKLLDINETPTEEKHIEESKTEEMKIIYFSLRPNDTFESVEELFGLEPGILAKLNPNIELKTGKLIAIPSK